MSVWSTNGNVSHVKLTLATSPSSQKPTFSFGCAKDGTNSCSFSSVDSDPRQLQAHVPIARSATTVDSVKLTVKGTGTHVTTAPKASESISVTAPGTSATPSGSSSASPAGAGTTIPLPTGATSPLPVGTLPFVNGGGSTLSPGGNASSLFPTISPSAGAQPPASHPRGPSASPVADALPADASVMGAQYAGLGALALAFILSVTRLSIRRRQAAKPGGTSGSGN